MLSQIEADIFVHLSQTVGYNEKMQKEKRPSHIYFVRRSQPLSLLRRQLPYRGEPLAKRVTFQFCQGLSSIGEVASRSDDGEVYFSVKVSVYSISCGVLMATVSPTTSSGVSRAVTGISKVELPSVLVGRYFSPSTSI